MWACWRNRSSTQWARWARRGSTAIHCGQRLPPDGQQLGLEEGGGRLSPGHQGLRLSRTLGGCLIAHIHGLVHRGIDAKLAHPLHQLVDQRQGVGEHGRAVAQVPLEAFDVRLPAGSRRATMASNSACQASSDANTLGAFHLKRSGISLRRGIVGSVILFSFWWPSFSAPMLRGGRRCPDALRRFASQSAQRDAERLEKRSDGDHRSEKSQQDAGGPDQDDQVQRTKERAPHRCISHSLRAESPPPHPTPPSASPPPPPAAAPPRARPTPPPCPRPGRSSCRAG